MLRIANYTHEREQGMNYRKGCSGEGSKTFVEWVVTNTRIRIAIISPVITTHSPRQMTRILLPQQVQSVPLLIS